MIGLVDDEEDDEHILSLVAAVEADAIAALAGGGRRGRRDGGGSVIGNDYESSNKRRKTASIAAGDGGVGGGGSEGSYTAALRGSSSSLWQQQMHGKGSLGYGEGRQGFSAGNLGNSGRDSSSSGTSSAGSCFKCGQTGHWARDCVGARAVEAGQEQRRAEGDGGDVAVKACPCGLGDCLVLTSNTARNPGRKFYRCPLKEENGGCNFFGWCDSPASGVPSSRGASNYPSNSSVPGLLCPCGAGSCLVLTTKTGKNAGQQYYRCPAYQGRGSCGFFKWCNQFNPVASQPASQSSFYNIQNNTGCQSSGGRSVSSCFKCGLEGHWARDCPHTLSDSQADMGGNLSASSGTCFKCGRAGHWARECSAQDTSLSAGRRQVSDSSHSSYSYKS